MFDTEIFAGVKSINVKVKEKDGVVTRRCLLVLEREFDETIAHGLGDAAKRARRELESYAMESCVLSIDAVDAEGVLQAHDEQVKIGRLTGVRAKAKCGDQEDETPPSIALEFEFQWNAEAWLFFGRNCGGIVRLTLRERQLELAGTGGTVHPLRS